MSAFFVAVIQLAVFAGDPAQTKVSTSDPASQTAQSAETTDDALTGEEDLIELKQVEPDLLFGVEPPSETIQRPQPIKNAVSQVTETISEQPPVRYLDLMRKEVLQLSPLDATTGVVDTMLGPVREANLLLPRRLDFLSSEEDKPLLPTLTDSEDDDFKQGEQRKLLNSRLSMRVDTPDEKATWRWRVQGGGSFRQGNTSTTNIHSTFDASRSSDKSSIVTKLGVRYNRSGDDDPNRRADGELVWDRNLRGRWVFYAKDEAEYDQARNIDLRNLSSAGLGFKFIDRVNHRLLARSGPTVSHVIYAPEAENDDETRSGWLLESEYRHLIADYARVEMTTSVFPNFDDEQQFRLRNDAALLFPIGSKSSPWSWKLGLRHDYQLDPTENTREGDVEGYFSVSFAK